MYRAFASLHKLPNECRAAARGGMSPLLAAPRRCDELVLLRPRLLPIYASAVITRPASPARRLDTAAVYREIRYAWKLEVGLEGGWFDRFLKR